MPLQEDSYQKNWNKITLIYTQKELNIFENSLPGILIKVELSALFEDDFNKRYKGMARRSLWDKFRDLFYDETFFNVSVRIFESKVYKKPVGDVFYKSFYLCYSYEDISNFELSSDLEEFLEWI